MAARSRRAKSCKDTGCRASWADPDADVVLQVSVPTPGKWWMGSMPHLLQIIRVANTR